MLKNRNFVSLVIVVILLISITQLATAKTEIYPKPAPTMVKKIGKQLSTRKSVEDSLLPTPIAYETCIDMPYGAAASVYACPNPSQVPVPRGWHQEDKLSKTPRLNAPSELSAYETCIDMPYGAAASVYACPNPSQVPVPRGWHQENKLSKTSRLNAPSELSAHETCIDMPFGGAASVYACPNPSQIPITEGEDLRN